MSVIYSEFRGVVSLYSNSILGASSEAINVAASSPGSEVCSLRKDLELRKKIYPPSLTHLLMCFGSHLFAGNEFVRSHIHNSERSKYFAYVLFFFACINGSIM